MDHHCPWICIYINILANCVGFMNYKYFFLVLVYSSLSLIFISFTYWEELALVVSNTNVISFALSSQTFMCIGFSWNS